MMHGKAVDDGYRDVHVYYQKSGKHYPIETGRVIRERYECGLIRNKHEFKEGLNNVLSGSERS